MTEMNEPIITETAYSDFSLDFHRQMRSRRIPIKGQIELTSRCNLKCVHCYEADDFSRKELSFEELTGIIDQLHHEGCLWLSLTGGDPLVRKDFLDIYCYAKRKGFLVTILTAGTLMTREIADCLAKEPPLSIDMTLNGITRETYEKISRIPGSFKKAIECIKLILDRNLPLKVKTKATTLNYHELDSIKQFVHSLGVEYKPNGLIFPRLDGSLEPCTFRLSPDQTINMGRFYPDTYEADDKCPINDTQEGRFIPSNKLVRCAAGISSFYISPYGELIFCTFMRDPSFDLRKGAFKEGFRTLYPEIHSLKYQTDSECKECKISSLCSNCPALAALETNNPEKPVKDACELAHQIAGYGD